MDIQKYINMPNAKMPEEIVNRLGSQSSITPTDFKDKNEILYSELLQNEIGFVKMAGGDYLVAMTCYMKGVTKEMVDWWFWWHPQANERYVAWFPGEHFRIDYPKKYEPYFNAKDVPPFQDNMQRPVERVGNMKMPLSINFVSPVEYGFTEQSMRENKVATIVCGTVGVLNNLFLHTEMAHIFFQKEDGLYLVSRFWIGKKLNNKILRKIMLTSETAHAMAEHCCIEYRNFAKKVPVMYNEYLQEKM